jgi:thioredoxin 1
MSENVGQVGDQDFGQQVLQADVPVLVDFWAEWCTPCHIIAPLVEEIAREHAGKMRAVKLNVDESPLTVQQYGVMSIPTLILFKAGQEIARMVGARPKDAIWRELQEHVAA